MKRLTKRHPDGVQIGIAIFKHGEDVETGRKGGIE